MQPVIQEGVKRGFRIIPIVEKEVKQLIRDPKTVLMVLAMPVLITIMFGYGYGGKEVGQFPITVVNLDHGEGSYKFIDDLKNSRMFKIEAIYNTRGEGFASVYRGEVYSSVVIPPTFTEDLMMGRVTRIEVIYDASNPQMAKIIMQAVGVVTQLYQEWAAERFGTFAIKPVFYTVYGPSVSKVENFMPGVMAMILQMVPTSLISVSVCRERERGTFEQFIMTPITVFDVIMGKLVAYFGATISDAALTLVTAMLLFDVRLRGSFFDMVVVSTVFLLTSLSMGLFISVFSKNQLQAYQASIFSFILATLFSGFLYPVDVLSPFAQTVAGLIPMYYFIEAFRAVSLKGWTLDMVTYELAVMMLFTVAFLAMAMKFLKLEVG